MHVWLPVQSCMSGGKRVMWVLGAGYPRRRMLYSLLRKDRHGVPVEPCTSRAEE